MAFPKGIGGPFSHPSPWHYSHSNWAFSIELHTSQHPEAQEIGSMHPSNNQHSPHAPNKQSGKDPRSQDCHPLVTN
jgi:hypothetical protein